MLTRLMVLLALLLSGAALLGAECKIESHYGANGKIEWCMTCCERDGINCTVQCF